MAEITVTIPFTEFGPWTVFPVPGRPAGQDTYRTVNDLQATSISPYDNIIIGTINARPAPSVPQFDGTVSPIRSVKVSLRRADRGVLETVLTDVNGYFAFTGWYYPHTDYEIIIHGDDVYQMKVYPISTPVEHRWNGAPDRYDSTVIT